MYRKPSKRKQQVRLFFTYVLMTSVILSLVTVFVLIMLGYQFNRTDGKIEQGGLMQLDSSPGGATVTIDGQNFGSRTPARTTIPAGDHFVTMNRQGYRTWQKSAPLRAGSILWLNYARLIPTTLTPNSVKDFTTVSSSLPSPNDRVMAVVTDPAQPQIELSNITGDTVETTTLSLTKEAITTPAAPETQKFTLVAWGNESRRMLVKHTYDDKSEWLVVDTDRETDNVINITTKLGINPVELKFRPSNSEQLYTLADGELRRIDIDPGTITGPIASHVSEFSVADDGMVSYIAAPEKDSPARIIGYISDGETTAQTLRTINDIAGQPLHVATGVYFGKDYVAITTGAKLEILHAELANSGEKDGTSSLQMLHTTTIANPADRVSIRTKGRFVVVEHGVNYSTYDLEVQKFSTTTVAGQTTPTAPLDWLDSYYTWHDDDGTLRLTEFDGANQQSIMTVVPGMTATLSSNGKYLYAFTKSADGHIHLSRVQLVLG